MPTPAHTDFNAAKPDGAGTPAATMTDDQNNLKALRDWIIYCLVSGAPQVRTNGTGTANQPQYITWWKASLGFRWNITWTGFNPTTIQVEWSNDTTTGVDGTWTAIGSAQVNTFVSDNITSSTISGGASNLMLELWSKTLRVVSDVATHLAAAGTSVHGLGTLSTQNANAIAATGGTTNAVDAGLTTPAKTDAQRVRETIDNAGAVTVVASGGTFTPDVSQAGYFKFQPNATTSALMTIAAPSNPPSSSRTQTITLEIVNGRRDIDGRITWNAAYHWLAGSTLRTLDTALEVAGSNIFYATWNGATWDISPAGKRG